MPSNLWVSGNIIYSLVVIMVNVIIAWNSYTQSWVSITLIVLSILSFYVVYGIENLIAYFPNLYLTFPYMMRIPSYYFLILFVSMVVIYMESLIHWVAQWYN